jgi:hypothetical protein
MQTAASTLSAAKVVFVILSPGHLEYLRNISSLCYQNCQQGVIFLCGVEEKELSQKCSSGAYKLSEHFPNFSGWIRLAHNAKSTTLQDAVDSLIGVRLLQTTASSEEPTLITVAFAKPLDDKAKVEVILSDEGGQSLCTSVIAERVNPQTYLFTAPEHKEGKVIVKIKVDNAVLPTSLSLAYCSVTSTINDVTQIYMHLMNTMCTLLVTQFTGGAAAKQRPSVANLDEKLSSLFDLDSDSDEAPPPSAFEKLFGIYQYYSCVDKEYELPTLLHFAAKFGLNELCAKLIDLPDAAKAFDITNRNRQQPSDIAQANNHIELARFLQSYHDMDKKFESLYVSYYNETGGRYENTKRTHDVAESHYTPMNRSGYVPHTGQQPEYSEELYVEADNGPVVNMLGERRRTAEVMFHDLQMKQKQAKSFKEKQECLLQIKEEVNLLNAQANTGKAGGSALAVSTVSPPIMVQRSLQAGQRTSNASLSSRDSAASRASSTSGFDSDHNEDEPPPYPPVPPRRQPAGGQRTTSQVKQT